MTTKNNDLVNTWGYDTNDRLTSEANDQAGGTTLDYSTTFGYDGAFNPTTFEGTSQTFNSDNQQSSPGSFTFDGNGNPTTYKGTSASFDRENLMTAVGLFQAKYRADGLRAWKAWDLNVPAGGDPIAVTSATYYHYDGGVPVLETDGYGTVTGVNVFADDGLVARKQSGSWRYYQFDPQGSVAHRTTSTETVINSSKYDAYGEHVNIPTGGGSDPFGWNGRWGYYGDAETGLALCMHRYYDADAGRWLTRDPIAYAGGVNLYGYCGGNPVLWQDVQGLDRKIAPSVLNNLVQAIKNMDWDMFELLVEDVLGYDLPDEVMDIVRNLKFKKCGPVVREKPKGLLENVLNHSDKIKNEPNSRARNKWLGKIETSLIDATGAIKPKRQRGIPKTP